jgi:hypothetical protein
MRGTCLSAASKGETDTTAWGCRPETCLWLLEDAENGLQRGQRRGDDSLAQIPENKPREDQCSHVEVVEVGGLWLIWWGGRS